MIERCTSVADVVSNVREIILHENEMYPNEDAEYFFRGEYRSYYGDDEFGTAFQSSLDRKMLVAYEREIYNDALRLNIADFQLDETMSERIARMQHYQLPTRFADISENVFSSLYFAVTLGYGGEQNLSVEEDGYIRVLKVARHKIKQFNSDIIIAISHLPLVKPCQINMHEGVDGVDSLRYEITNSRPGFGIAADDEIKNQLINDLQQIWVFRPVYNNRRLSSQSGLFLAFGCGDQKASLKPSFAPNDYDDEAAPSYGIKQIEYIRIAGDKKRDIENELRYYGVSGETIYPELANVNGAITRKYETMVMNTMGDNCEL